jgi:hypothetical protein
MTFNKRLLKSANAKYLLREKSELPGAAAFFAKARVQQEC